MEALKEIAQETYARTFGSMNTPETMQAYLAEAFSRERMLQELSQPGSKFFFLRADTGLCGYLKLNEAPAQSDLNDPESLEIERIYVREQYQGKGLGKVLINYSLDVARQRGKGYVWLGVWEKNTNAISFYKRMGFEVKGEHSFRMGDEIQHDVIMWKVISET